jgi:opacity protein-like surface antigen
MTGKGRWVVLLAMVLLLGWSPTVGAEVYVGGELGLSLPQPFSSIQLGGGGTDADTTSSDQAVRASLLYGAKLGYYFDSLPWLGVETELFNTNPHWKQQDTTISISGLGSTTSTSSGTHARVLTWANDVMVRYPGKTFQPYAGVGPAIFFSRFAGIGDALSPGLDVKGGLRIFLTDKIAAFGEYKYNYTSATAGGECCNVSFIYQAHALAFGLSYHFK